MKDTKLHCSRSPPSSHCKKPVCFHLYIYIYDFCKPMLTSGKHKDLLKYSERVAECLWINVAPSDSTWPPVVPRPTRCTMGIETQRSLLEKANCHSPQSANQFELKWSLILIQFGTTATSLDMSWVWPRNDKQNWQRKIWSNRHTSMYSIVVLIKVIRIRIMAWSSSSSTEPAARSVCRTNLSNYQLCSLAIAQMLQTFYTNKRNMEAM